MCGPFTRELRPAPSQFVQQQLLQQQAAAQRQAEAAAANVSSQQLCQLPQFPVADASFLFPQEVKKVDFEPLLPQADDVFNWDLFDDQFGGLDTFGVCEVPAAPQQPAQEAKFDFSLDAPAPSAATPAAPAAKPAKKVKRAPKAPKKEKPSTSLEDFESDVKTEDSDAALDEEMRQGTPYSEKLPKELLDHPCAATLLSAGIRIKGRTRDELIEVAERIKKRRRASAARCRARKASHINLLEDENHQLKDENTMLKQRIAELTGGNLPSYLGMSMNMQPQHQSCGMGGMNMAHMPMAF